MLGVFVVTVAVVVTALVLARSDWSIGTVQNLWRSRPVRAVWVNAAVVGLAALVVLVAVLYPLLADVSGPERTPVAGSFYTTILGPLAALGLVAVALLVGRRSPIALGLGAVVVPTFAHLAASVDRPGPLLLLACAGAAAGSAIDGLVARGRSGLGGHLAHLGMAALLVGVGATASGSDEAVTLGLGESATIGGVTFTLDDIAAIASAGSVRGDGVPSGPTSEVTATITIEGGHTMAPSLVSYAGRGQVLPETSLRTEWNRDIAIALRSAEDERALFEVRVRPLASLVFLGPLLLLAAGLAVLAKSAIAASGSRTSVEAP